MNAASPDMTAQPQMALLLATELLLPWKGNTMQEKSIGLALPTFEKGRVVGQTKVQGFMSSVLEAPRASQKQQQH